MPSTLESGAPLSELSPGLFPEPLSVSDAASLDELDPEPDPLLDEDEPKPVTEPLPDEEGMPLESPLLDEPPELALVALGSPPEPLALRDPPVEDADVASIAPPSFVWLALAPTVSTFPTQAALPSWPKTVTTTQAMRAR